jgi:hypothetical protein
MTENQKNMLFCMEVLRRREEAFIEENGSDKEPVGTQLMKLFFDEIGEPELFEPLVYGVIK